MASKFSSTKDVCEGDDCEAITDVTYRLEINKKLCLNCASKEPRILKPKKDRRYQYCKKHEEDIKLYCDSHGEAICHVGAMIDHQKPCVQKHISVAIKENRAKLNGLREKAKEKLKSCHANGNQLRQCRQDSDKHLQAVKDEVDEVIDEAIKTDKVSEQEDAAKINQEIDEKNQNLREQIQKLNEQIQQNDEEREKRLELNHTNAEKRRQPVDNKQRNLHADIQNIAEETEKKIGELEKSWQDDTKTIENTIQRLDTVLEDDRNVVKDGHHVITSVTNKLDTPMDEGGVKHITRTVSGVRFVKGAGREKYNGRIDGYDGEWKLVDTINMTEFKGPIIVGCKDECNVIITDGGSKDTYMLDMNTKHTQRVITGSDTSCVVSCALLNDDKVVCGKERKGCTGDSVTGCISVYDRQWKLITDVTIPKNTTDDDTVVYVAVDQDGMIIAADRYQSKIYVINPADGKIMNAITCKQKIVMRGVLSSGHIIAHFSEYDGRAFIIDREGAQREIVHSDLICSIGIDPMTDDLYIATDDDDECMIYGIYQVMSGSDMKVKKVASFPMRLYPIRLGLFLFYQLSSCMMMTSSGNMIASDGDNILVFKKMFSL